MTPEAQDVLEILDGRILAAEAGQASRELFLDALEPGDGCRDWEADTFWRRDPDLKAALEAACPDFRGRRRPGRVRRPDSHPAADKPPSVSLPSADSLRLDRSRSARPRGRVRLVQGIRPLAESASSPPELSARLPASPAGPDGPVAGGEATLAGRTPLRRRVWIDGRSYAAQAGRLDFGPEGSGPGPAADDQVAGIPHLAFVTGRRGFPGPGAISGVGGPWEARSPALDGVGFAARIPGTAGPGTSPWQGGGFGSWNRQVRSGGTAGPGPEARRDALAYSVGVRSAGVGARKESRGGREWALQAARLRLEDTGVTEIWLLGAAVQGFLAPGTDGADDDIARWRTGLALSGLERDAFHGGGDARPDEAGAYWEAEAQGGKSDRWSLAVRQATAGWANPLAAGRTLTRDTVAGGWILPGRGEGGMTLRARMDVCSVGVWRVSLATGAETDWSLAEGFLAGAGRVTLSVGAGAWEARSSRGLAWRSESAPSDAPPSIGAHTLAWSRGPWRAAGALSHVSQGRREAWPVRLEMARGDRLGNRWSLEGASGDVRDPMAAFRIACRQAWRLDAGIRILQTLSVPMERSELRKELGYRLGLEAAGF